MKMPILFPLALAVALNACQDAPALEDQLAMASIIDQEGNTAGNAALKRNDDTLFIELELSSLEPGTKAFHLHSVGKCDAPDFKSAGGHLNPHGKSHGKQSAGGQHLGDLPNVKIPESGSIKILIDLDDQTTFPLSTIDDDDGTAVMVHAGPDDYLSDPSGAAGPRIACGVLKPTDLSGT